jgi:hypothetical protein
MVGAPSEVSLSHPSAEAPHPLVAKLMIVGTPTVIILMATRDLGRDIIFRIFLIGVLVILYSLVCAVVRRSTNGRVSEFRGLSASALAVVLLAACGNLVDGFSASLWAALAGALLGPALLCRSPRLQQMSRRAWITAGVATSVLAAVTSLVGLRTYDADRVASLFELPSLRPSVGAGTCRSSGYIDYHEQCSVRLAEGGFEALTAQTEWTEEGCGKPRIIKELGVSFPAARCYRRTDGDFAKANRFGQYLVADERFETLVTYYWTS